MKKISILLLGFLTAISVQAQTGTSVQAVTKTSSVSIIVNGSKNLQMTIDERNSNLLNMKALVEKTTVSMDNLGIGSHTLQIVRTNQNNDRTERIATTFNLRNNYDMLIKVNRNGSIELIETKHTATADNLVAMSDRDFNTLLTSVRNQRSTARRSSAITDAFNNNKYFFTASQVKQLLQLVNSENSRIQLAKQSYPIITDRGNFYLLYELLNSEAGRNELEDFVNDYNDDRNYNTAMSDASFNILYQEIKKQWPDNIRMNSLTNAFINTNNYFSSYQASQLIQLVSAENNRLQLAKLSYRSITDPGNFNQVVNLISSQSGKNELSVYVNNFNNGIGTGLAMSDANFNILYQDINRLWPENKQVTSLTNAFSNTNNFFSSYQASQLIQLVSAENNRLQLAKLSFRSITDPNYFNQVINLISSQSGKNELIVYVNNYNLDNDSNKNMSVASFNTLYQDIKNQWNVNAQMTSLTNAFNNTNNNFSSYQASQLIQLVSAENNRLQLAKLSYRSITDPGNFNQVVSLISSQSGKNELTAYVNNNYNTGSSPNLAMTDANFNILYQDINRQWPENTQMNSLTSAFSNIYNFFSSYQASQLIQLVSAENNRLQLAKLSYRGITDPGNFNQVVNLISSQTSKNELTAYVNNNYNTGNSPNVAMSDANFTALIQSIERQFLPFEQMRSLTEVFNNTSYYFSSAQAKQLIPLVSYEGNRLQLAKLSYRTITDRGNFNQLYDLLDSQSSKNELDAYVKAYKN